MTLQVFCPHCGAQAEFVDSARVYRGNSYGMIYDCRPCDAYVGVHKAGSWRWENGVRVEHQGNEPLGSLANAQTRRARKQAHAMFDGLWMHGHMKRQAAYGWLQLAMNLTTERCHIAHMTAEECSKVVELCRTWSPKRNKMTQPRNKMAPRRDSKPGVPTKRTDFRLPNCGCPAAPWEHCTHSVGVWPVVE